LIAELGLFSLALAFALSLLQAALPLAGAQRRDSGLMRAGASLAIGQCLFLGAAFASLMILFAGSDFSVRIVAENSHTDKPMLYKLAGAWGNHEGSMLLWALILALYGAAVAIFGRELPATLKARVLSVQGMIGAAFIAFIFFTSNPFDRLSPAPFNGADLNPLLQDPGLAFHPPLLYLGYVGFSMAFSFSIAALIEGRVDSAWARWVRPWTLAAWSFLTLGIALGSWWAYYELGWGGWWFWDPVENASLMPWLAGTALLHSALVVERRQTLVNWTVLLGVTTFSLSLVGTFLVRSGVLTSVHAFAVDPARGVFILAMLAMAAGGGFTLYALRAKALEAGPTFAALSREGALVVNNIFLAAATGTVFVGTFYPLLIDLLSDDKLTVGPPYFNITFAPLMALLALAMAAGPLLKWRKDQMSGLLRALRAPAAIAVCAAVAIAVVGKSAIAAIGFALSSFLIAGVAVAFFRRIRLFEATPRESLRLAFALPAAALALLIAHASFGFAAMGAMSMSVFAEESVAALKQGESLAMGRYRFTLLGVETGEGPNYAFERARITVASPRAEIATLSSERRFYPVRDMQTTEAGIRAGAFMNFYVALGEPAADGSRVVRAYVHPLASFIWLGALGMAAGGFVSLADRRFRLGARARAPKGATAAAE
jgi:cytochrome c-type biogenesis protein CcmF